ncbi:branched-chain amino acid aminotransferase [Erythrobacter sp. SD-21]|nr:branched-chain amino acid aminotransferase [Erythrobacter sp. SD-21]
MSIDDAEFEDVKGEIVSINLIPSNTGTTYVATVLIQKKYKTQLVLNPARLTNCRIGKTVDIVRRGLDHRWTKKSCSGS